jgi:hypothetical protein
MVATRVMLTFRFRLSRLNVMISVVNNVSPHALEFFCIPDFERFTIT